MKNTDEKGKFLGKYHTEYKDTYDKTLLVGLPRAGRREGYTKMYGYDIWTAFEFSFLLPNGLPYFGVLRTATPCNSEKFFESKSYKLYLNSFNNSVFNSVEDAIKTVEQDLSEITESKVTAQIMTSLKEDVLTTLEQLFPNIEIQDYVYNCSLLKSIPSTEETQKVLVSNLLRSNCEITNQPDWGRVTVSYIPDKLEIDPESLLKYIVSYRKHQEFHEPTCERIYQDVFNLIKPKKLAVTCHYTRRGGIDINPVRISSELYDGIWFINLLPKTIHQ